MNMAFAVQESREARAANAQVDGCVREVAEGDRQDLTDVVYVCYGRREVGSPGMAPVWKRRSTRARVGMARYRGGCDRIGRGGHDRARDGHGDQDREEGIGRNT
jgi:hypothetical protein